MKSTLYPAALLLPLLAACSSQVQWRTDEALDAEMLELQVDSEGVALEIEYHVLPEVVPKVVHEAMNALHPGGEATGAEKEYVGSTLYWELTKEIEGREIEAMFRPDGTLHSEEIEIAASAVPEAVRAAVAERLGGKLKKWEEIRDAKRELVEYHAKVSAEGRNYKVLVSPGGKILGVVRELRAEIELPVEG